MSNGRPPTYLTTFPGELLLDFLKQGNLRNCTKLSELFLGFYETGKFKELYKIEEPRQDGLVVPFRSVLAWFDGEFGGEFGRFFWSVLALPFSVGDRPGNCLFHWVFWELAPVLTDSANLASKVDFIQCPPY